MMELVGPHINCENQDGYATSELKKSAGSLRSSCESILSESNSPRSASPPLAVYSVVPNSDSDRIEFPFTTSTSRAALVQPTDGSSPNKVFLDRSGSISPSRFIPEIDHFLIKAKFEEIQAATVCDSTRPKEEVHKYLTYPKDSPFRDCFRFFDIPCIKSTLVYDDETGFFHGNYVKYKSIQAIVTQLPVPKSINMFWKIVYEKGAVVIDLIEGRNESKSYRPIYPRNYGQLQVRQVLAEKIGSSFSRYRFSIKHENEDPIEKDIIHYYEWKDGQGTQISDLILLINLVRSYMTQDKYPIIHCRAGMGRSGSLFTLLCTTDAILQGEIDRSILLDKLRDIILACRPQRGSLFVQSKEQFECIVRTCESILRDPSQIVL